MKANALLTIPSHIPPEDALLIRMESARALLADLCERLKELRDSLARYENREVQP
jgi:hypothetical protein